MSKMFVVAEQGVDCPLTRGVYTSLHKALCAGMRVEKESATDHGLFVHVFKVDHEIELDNNNSLVKHSDRIVGIMEGKKTENGTVSVQLELYSELIPDIDITDLINGVCGECGLNIDNIRYV